MRVFGSRMFGQAHCIRVPPPRYALRRRARPSRDGAQPDDGDVTRRGDERPLKFQRSIVLRN